MAEQEPLGFIMFKLANWGTTDIELLERTWNNATPQIHAKWEEGVHKLVQAYLDRSPFRADEPPLAPAKKEIDYTAITKGMCGG